MKILDLLERQIDTQVEPDAKYKRNFMRTRFDAGDESIFGNWARVAPSKKDPHMVVKNSTIPSRKPDNYNKYIQELIKRDLIDTNPHFPRVYNVKKITDNLGQEVYKYVMEKLIPWDQLSLEEMQTLADRILAKPPTIPRSYTDKEEWNYLYDRISAAFEDESKGDDSKIKQKSIKYAIKELIDIGRSWGLEWPNDVGGNNIMFRRTPIGVQPVITDPFYN